MRATVVAPRASFMSPMTGLKSASSTSPGTIISTQSATSCLTTVSVSPSPTGLPARCCRFPATPRSISTTSSRAASSPCAWPPTTGCPTPWASPTPPQPTPLAPWRSFTLPRRPPTSSRCTSPHAMSSRSPPSRRGSTPAWSSTPWPALSNAPTLSPPTPPPPSTTTASWPTTASPCVDKVLRQLPSTARPRATRCSSSPPRWARLSYTQTHAPVSTPHS
mmetsp:Transcript_17671/g.42111  ORF Transcript_17671/g.42111 Transcript_17671/m.42111 type:complete len:220 (-) Transcript_17671:500-1159(-)